MSLVEVNVHGQNIDITIPQAKILSHEIDQESIEVFDETKIYLIRLVLLIIINLR